MSSAHASLLWPLLGLLLLHGAAAQAKTFADIVESLNTNSSVLNPAASYAHLDLHPESEAAINQQINTELSVSHLYLGLWAHFASESVGLPAVAAWFKNESAEEREHAEQLMEHMNLRGGKVQFQDITYPHLVFNDTKRGPALQAMEVVLALESSNYANLQKLHSVAVKHGDALLSDFVVGTMLTNQALSVRKIAGYVRELQATGESEFA